MSLSYSVPMLCQSQASGRANINCYKSIHRNKSTIGQRYLCIIHYITVMLPLCVHVKSLDPVCNAKLKKRWALLLGSGRVWGD